jgi:outer membrane protein W
MKTWSLALVLGLVLVVAGSPAVAAEESQNIVRFGAQWVMPLGEYKDPSGGTISADDAVGYAVQFEHKFTGVFGLEFGLAYTSLDFTAELAGVKTPLGTASMRPFSVAGNFHALKDKKVDLYFGAQIAWVTYGDLTIDASQGGGNQNLTTDFGYGALIGLDIPFGKSAWGLSMQARYLKTKAGSGEQNSIAVPIDPLAFQLAARVQF